MNRTHFSNLTKCVCNHAYFEINHIRRIRSCSKRHLITNFIQVQKIFYLSLFLCFTFYTSFSQSVRENESDNIYSLDFVFTGKVNPGLDSVFALRYKFSSNTFKRFNTLVLEDSHQRKILNVKQIQSNDSIEVRADGTYTFIILKIYHKDDLPLLTQGEDVRGSKQDLIIHYIDGSIQSPQQFKQVERAQQMRVKQMRLGRN